MLRRGRRPEPPRLPDTGEMILVRAYAGSRAAEEPRAIVVDGVDLPVEEISWRATVAENGRLSRAFVVRVAGGRLRITYDEDDGTWTVGGRLGD